jgi:hypothetical protein
MDGMVKGNTLKLMEGRDKTIRKKVSVESVEKYAYFLCLTIFPCLCKNKKFPGRFVKGRR